MRVYSPSYYDSLTFSYLNDTIFSLKVCFFLLPVMNFMIKIWDSYRIRNFDQNIRGLRLKREKLKPKKTDSCLAPPHTQSCCLVLKPQEIQSQLSISQSLIFHHNSVSTA